MSDLHIRVMTPEDWEAVANIYREGIATGDATFESDVPTWPAWDADHLPTCRFVAMDAGHASSILGWAALSTVSGRCVYAGVAEVSVYVAEAARGRGVGTALLRTLVQGSEAEGLWTLQAGIFPENLASIRIHEKCGFRVLGTYERLGQMHGRWRDVTVMERRSSVVGR